MKKCFPLLIAGVLLTAVGCDKQTHPSGPVDTSDPNKTHGTMTPVPKAGKESVTPTGMPKGMPKGP